MSLKLFSEQLMHIKGREIHFMSCVSLRSPWSSCYLAARTIDVTKTRCTCCNTVVNIVYLFFEIWIIFQRLYHGSCSSPFEPGKQSESRAKPFEVGNTWWEEGWKKIMDTIDDKLLLTGGEKVWRGKVRLLFDIHQQLLPLSTISRVSRQTILRVSAGHDPGHPEESFGWGLVYPDVIPSSSKLCPRDASRTQFNKGVIGHRSVTTTVSLLQSFMLCGHGDIWLVGSDWGFHNIISKAGVVV